MASRGHENPARKSCGRLVPRKISVGVSGCLNQAPAAWPMKLVASVNSDASANNCRGLAERGKSIEARQHDEVERERRQIDRQMGDAAAEHGRERSAGGSAPCAITVSIEAPISSICCRIRTNAAGTM